MTPFAQLADSGLQKAAAGKATAFKLGWRGIKDLVGKGFWNVAGSSTNSPKWLQTVSRPFYNPNTGKSTGLYKGLLGYGAAGMASDMMGGPSLPGSELAFNTTMPGLGALFAAPGLITGARMAKQENQDKLRQDVIGGGQDAAAEFLSLLNSSPGVVQNPGLYSQIYNQTESPMSGNPFTKPYQRPNWWTRTGNFLMNPQAYIDDRVTQEVHGYLNNPLTKSGMEKRAWLGAVGNGLKWAGGRAMKALPWLGVGSGLGMAGYSAMSDKPYDPTRAQNMGFQAGQVQLQEALNGLNGIERFAASLDPTLVARKLEQKIPGTISRWEQQTGMRYQPGWIAGTLDAFDRGGNSKYYEYDAAGQRHYV